MGLETLSYAAFSHPPIFYCEKCGLAHKAIGMRLVAVHADQPRMNPQPACTFSQAKTDDN